MQEAIRDVRVTTSCTSDHLSSGIRRCNILDTSAYMAIRLKLLRWISSNPGNDTRQVGHEFSPVHMSTLAQDGGRSTGHSVSRECEENQMCMCHIGNGISVRAWFPPESSKVPPTVHIVWRHLDNDLPIPVTDHGLKDQTSLSTLDDEWGGDDSPGMAEKGVRGSTNKGGNTGSGKRKKQKGRHNVPKP